MVFIFVVILIIKIFYSWFNINFTLSSGDWPYLFIENIKEFSFLPQSGITWLTPYYQIPAKIFVEYLNIDWKIVERLFWFWPFLTLSLFSSWYLSKNFFSNNYRIIGAFIFLTNTYSLMLVGGGQMGVALAYSISPLVLAFFIKLMNRTLEGENNLKLAIIAGLILSLQGVFDIRIVYVTLVGVIIFYLIRVLTSNSINNISGKNIILSTFYVFIIPLLITLVSHLYWIIPQIFIKNNTLSELSSVYTSLDAVKFFSFASFSQAFSLLHPNWPENIFGKTYFLRPEFILLPILAFSSLFFLNFSAKDKLDEKNKKIALLGFLLVGLIGTFLAKGSNPPFGGVYSWMFNYLPGFIMFRDPTKWYLLIVLSYSMLIPFTLSELINRLSISNKKTLKGFTYLILIMFLLVWTFSIKEAVFGQLTGTFRLNSMPQEYLQLKKYILSEPDSSKTLWIPTVQRYGFSSKSHPALDARIFLNSNLNSIQNIFNDPKIQKKIKDQGIRYVIVPYDSQKEIYIRDRKYSNEEYKKILNEVQQIEWLKYDRNFGEIFVFKVNLN